MQNFSPLAQLLPKKFFVFFWNIINLRFFEVGPIIWVLGLNTLAPVGLFLSQCPKINIFDVFSIYFIYLIRCFNYTFQMALFTRDTNILWTNILWKNVQKVCAKFFGKELNKNAETLQKYSSILKDHFLKVSAS